jgi:hypothetical protein
MKTNIISSMQNLNLSEEYWQPKEQIDLRKCWSFDEDIDLFVHVVYNSLTYELIYYQASSEDFIEELPVKTFLEGWIALKEGSEWERRMFKTTYAMPPTRAPRKMKLPDKLEQILAPTQGYLIYQDQMSDILTYVRQATPALVPMYIQNWNIKKPATRLMVSSVWVQGVNLDDLIEDRAYDSENQFLYS